MEIDKKKLSAALIEAMDKEELHTSECARLLNMKSCYISMAKSEKSWDAMGKAPWLRIEEWLNTRLPLKEFVILMGEPIEPIPIRSAAKITPRTDAERANADSAPPQVPDKKESKPRKEKNGKSVKVILFQGELEKLQKRLQGLEEQNTLLMNDNNQLSQEVRKLREIVDNIGRGMYVLEDETIPFMRAQIEDLLAFKKQHLIDEANKTLEAKPAGNSIVIFQRNYPKA